MPDFEWLLKTLKYENPMYFFFNLPKPKFFIETEKQAIKKDKIKYLELIFEHLMVYKDLLEGTNLTQGSPLKTFLTEKNNEKFQKFRKNYRSQKQLFSKLGQNFSIKYFRKYENQGKLPQLLDLSAKEKQKHKWFIPKYMSKYLEKTENILKRLRKEMENLDSNLQKTIYSSYAISEIFAELFNQKKLLESKMSKRFDNLQQIFSSTNKFFINLGGKKGNSRKLSQGAEKVAEDEFSGKAGKLPFEFLRHGTEFADTFELVPRLRVHPKKPAQAKRETLRQGKMARMEPSQGTANSGQGPNSH